MANSKIDNNNRHTEIIVDDGGTIRNLLVDPSTNRLLIQVNLMLEVSRTINTQTLDENDRDVSIIVNDSGVIQPLLIDNRNGFLLVDLLLE